MELSVVTTMYRSAPYLKEFHGRIRAEAEKFAGEYEIIFVNDGSPDDSLEVALSLFENDPHVKVVDLSRNFGHHKAMMTGLSMAKGDLVFLIDVDLEEAPELLGEFHEAMKNEDADVVYGRQQSRKGGFVEAVSGEIFYGLMNLLSSYPIPRNLITVRLMKKRYVDALVQHKDQEIFIAGLWAITGFKQVARMVTKRQSSETTYDFKRKIAILINSITSFSNKPLIFIFYLGTLISIFSILTAGLMVIRKIFYEIDTPGWAGLIVSVWILGGVTIFCIGIIGIYLSKIFTETKERPYTIVRELYDRSSRQE